MADSVRQAAAAFGGLGVAVANAGVQLFGEGAGAEELDLAVWSATLTINLTGAFLLCKHALRSLLAAPGNSIICTASPTGLRRISPGFDACSASKAGIAGLIRVMAADYRPEAYASTACSGSPSAVPEPRTRSRWSSSLQTRLPT